MFHTKCCNVQQKQLSHFAKTVILHSSNKSQLHFEHSLVIDTNSAAVMQLSFVQLEQGTYNLQGPTKNVPVRTQGSRLCRPKQEPMRDTFHSKVREKPPSSRLDNS